MSPRIYAYVTSEICNIRYAVRPGTSIGDNDVPVSHHDDFHRWCYGKRETLAIIANGGPSDYVWQCAKRVAELLDWPPLPITQEEEADDED